MTPSKRRRAGREAFRLGDNPYDECPYKHAGDRSDYAEGWYHALAEFNAKQAEQEKKDSDWIRNQIKKADNIDELKDALLEMYDVKF